MAWMNGTIKRLVRDKGFGFIGADRGAEYFFHRSACTGNTFEGLREGSPSASTPAKVRKSRAPRTSEARTDSAPRLSWKFSCACAENSARAGIRRVDYRNAVRRTPPAMAISEGMPIALAVGRIEDARHPRPSHIKPLHRHRGHS
jgi:cold shock CspA family protein